MKLTWRPVAPGDGPTIPTSVTPAESDELRRLAAGKRVLEVGSGHGYSTVLMALAGALVTAVDPHTWLGSYPQLVANLDAYQVLGRVQVVQLDAWVALPALAAEGRTFEVVFLDGDHADHATTHDARWAARLLADGGVLACHDYGSVTCPGVAAALDRLLGAPDRLVGTLAVYRAPHLPAEEVDP